MLLILLIYAAVYDLRLGSRLFFVSKGSLKVYLLEYVFLSIDNNIIYILNNTVRVAY